MNNYHNKLSNLESVLDTHTLLNFCQNNRVDVIQAEDGLCHCYINGQGSYAEELDSYSAMVFGIYNYLEHQKKLAK